MSTVALAPLTDKKGLAPGSMSESEALTVAGSLPRKDTTRLPWQDREPVTRVKAGS